jgi:hypothetical protein
MNKFTFLFALLCSTAVQLNGQGNAYCFTVTQTNETPTTVSFAFQLIHNIAAGADYSINISGTNGLASSGAIINNYLAGANDVSALPGSHAGNFTFTKTGVAPYTIFVDESLPEYAVVIANTSILIPSNCGALPVSLKHFTAKAVERSSVLQWEVAAEVNTSHYEVERSGNGLQFSKLGRVVAVSDQRSSKAYDYVDRNPLPGVNYYRLRMVDKNAAYSYSNMAEVRFGHDDAVQIIPNPTKDITYVSYMATAEGYINFQVVDMNGRLLQTRTIERMRGMNNTSFDLSALAQGVYWITLQDETSTRSYRVVRAAD